VAGTEPPAASTASSSPGAQLAAADERERASRDLADLVLQRLFGLGATLVAVSSTADEATAERLRSCVDDLDQTIDALRDGILHQTPMAACDQTGPGPVPPAVVIALSEAVAAASSEAPSEPPPPSARPPTRSLPSKTSKGRRD
jgi:signal transduction histidine kinase